MKARGAPYQEFRLACCSKGSQGSYTETALKKLEKLGGYEYNLRDVKVEFERR